MEDNQKKEDKEDKEFIKAVDTLGNSVDLSFKDFVKVTIDSSTGHYVFIRSILKDWVTNFKYVHPMQPWHQTDKRISYLGVSNYRFDFTNVEMEPILGMPFLGTTSFVVKNIFYTDNTGTHKVLAAKQYVRVVRDYIFSMLRAMAVAQELQSRSVPWVGIVKAYLSKQVKYYMLKSFYFYVERKTYKTKKGEVREYNIPELRLYFIQNSLGHLGRGKQYLFEFYMYVPRTFYTTVLAANTNPEQQKRYVEEVKSYVKKALEGGG
jgi:hypothetical protein